MFPVVNASDLQCVAVNVQFFPKEGPKAVPFDLDFSTGNGVTLDLSQFQNDNRISGVQTLYIDNSQANAGTITITMDGTGQVITVKANTQGYYPVLCGPSVIVRFSSTGTNRAKGFALNVPVAPFQWATS